MYRQSTRRKSINCEKGTNDIVQKKLSSPSSFQLLDNRPDKTVQRQTHVTNNQVVQQQSNQNNTGLPDQLKSGIENLSGQSLDDVKVHYNSDKPSQLQAHAFAQGNNIHLAAGQEQHLPHEAWHVVQQKQGRVKPTLQMKGGVDVNDDYGLEREADIMGQQALNHSTGHSLNKTAYAPSQLSTAIQKQNIIQSKGGLSTGLAKPFQINLFGTSYHFANGTFTTEEPKYVAPKGDGFNATNSTIKNNYGTNSLSVQVPSKQSNWNLNLYDIVSSRLSSWGIMKNLLSFSSGLGVQIPGGDMSLGMDMGVKELKLTNDKKNQMVASLSIAAKGEVAAKTMIEAGSNTNIVDLKVKGAIKGAAELDLGDIESSLTINLSDDQEGNHRTVDSFGFNFEADPKFNLGLEGSVSLRTTYLLNKLKQDWIVLYVKGLGFQGEGSLKMAKEPEGGLTFSAGDSWSFDTTGTPKATEDGVKLESSGLVEEAENVGGLFDKEEVLFGKRPEKAPVKATDESSTSNFQGMKGFTEAVNSQFVSPDQEYASSGYWNWIKGGLVKTAKQTALTTIKDQLESDASALTALKEKLTDFFMNKTLKLGEYLHIKIVNFEISPEQGIIFQVSYGVNLFGSNFTSTGSVEMIYDIFHLYASHFEYDLQDKNSALKTIPLWQMHSSGMKMSAAGQSLILKGLSMADEELVIQNGQISLALPEAMGGHKVLLSANDLRFGEQVSWSLLGGETKSEFDLFGQKSIKVKKLMIGSANHSANKGGILFASTNLEIDLFNDKIAPKLTLAWDMDKRQFVGSLKDVNLSAIKIDEMMVSDRGLYIKTFNVSLKKVFDALPNSSILPSPNLDIKVEGFKITKGGVEITSATASVPKINMGPLSISNGSLGIEMASQEKPQSFFVSGEAKLGLWGLQASIGGKLAFEGSEFSQEQSHLSGSLDLGVMKMGVSNISFIDDGLLLKKPSLHLTPGKIKEVEALKPIIPGWLTKGLENTELLIEADSYNSKTNKFVNPKFIPLKLPVPLGYDKFAHFSYSKETKLAKLTIPSMAKSWDPGVELNIPLLHGIAGLSIGGELNFKAGLENETVITGQYDETGESQKLILNGDIELMLSAGATLSIGVYAGVPKIITVTGGVYAKGTWANNLSAHMGAEVQLGGDSDWWMKMGVKGTSQIKGEAGAFVAYTILGSRGRKDFPLAEKELAQWTLLGDITIGNNDRFDKPSFKINGNEKLKTQGEQSESEIKEQLKSAEILSNDIGHRIEQRTEKIDQTNMLLMIVNSHSKNHVDELMTLKKSTFDDEIRKEEAKIPSDPNKILVLKEQRDVWDKWSPGQIQIGKSRKERVTANLMRRNKELYELTMGLIKLKVVGETKLKYTVSEQIDKAEDIVNDLTRQRSSLTDSESDKAKKVSISKSIASYRELIVRLTALYERPLEKNPWETIDPRQKAFIDRAIQSDPSIGLMSKNNLKIAQEKHKQAVDAVKSIARQRQIFREQSGAESIATVEQLREVEQLMNEDHEKWYGERNTLWRRLRGFSTDSRVGEAVMNLKNAELELEFAKQQDLFTQTTTT